MLNAYLPRVLIYNWQLHRSPEGPPLQKKKYRDPVRIWKKETNLEGICSCTLWADALIHCNSFQAACVHRLTQLIMECFHSWNLGFNLGAQVGDSLGSIKGHLETNLIQIVSLSGPEEPCPRLQISAWRWQTPRWLFAWCNHHSHCLKSPHFCQSPDGRHIIFFFNFQLFATTWMTKMSKLWIPVISSPGLTGVTYCGFRNLTIEINVVWHVSYSQAATMVD